MCQDIFENLYIQRSLQHPLSQAYAYVLSLTVFKMHKVDACRGLQLGSMQQILQFECMHRIHHSDKVHY